ncbi:MAG TPA: type II toxin-antitoxin system VapC family toxin [Methylobacter sp.]|jgi:tRNA(fMet)-specific endonuclease VapC
MIYMLDTNILIYLIKNKPPSVAETINALDKDDVLCMSFITYAELLKGAERSTRKAQVLLQLDQLTQLIPVHYNTNHSLCEHYAAQFTRLKEAGTPIGANDLWIACHALSRDATLVTHNVREFERIDRLKLEDWVI